jgi:hypothetical protein
VLLMACPLCLQSPRLESYDFAIKLRVPAGFPKDFVFEMEDQWLERSLRGPVVHCSRE